MSGHIPVLLAEAISGLAINPDGIYIDATYGRGGHTKAILACLSDKGRLIAIDKDMDAVLHARHELASDSRFVIEHGSFARIKDIAIKHHVWGKVDGILADIGVSSIQLDDASRGFSFMNDGPLDMRMDKTAGPTAADVVNHEEMDALASIFRLYGEERFAGRIARAIVERRAKEPFERTLDLAAVVSQANPKWEKHKHPATRVFQAIRVYVNQELADLERLLKDGLDVLKVGGRFAVISFHSLEDRLVKQQFKAWSTGPVLPKGIPLRHNEIQVNFKCIGKPYKAQETEVSQNVRSRSAVLRIGEKIA